MFKLFSPKCVFCKRIIPRSEVRKYYSDRGKLVKVCYLCAPYAERRAYRKKNRL